MNFRISRFLSVLGPLLGLLFVIGLFMLSSEIRPYFLAGGNFKIILTQTVIVAIGALGMTLIIVSGGIDLSVGSVVALTGVVAAKLVIASYSGVEFSARDFTDASAFLNRVRQKADPVSAWFEGRLDATFRRDLAAWNGASPVPAELATGLVAGLNDALRSGSIWDSERFRGVTLRPETSQRQGQELKEADAQYFNRLLLEDAYPRELARIGRFPRVSPVVVLAVPVLVGGLVGVLNGAIIAYLRMLPFIVTLGMMGIVRGTSKWLASNQTVAPIDSPVTRSMRELMMIRDSQHLFPLPVGVWVAAVLALIMAVVLRQTVFGRYIFAIGSNEATARLCGIRVPRHKVWIYGLSGLFVGLAGVMQYSRLNIGDPTVANGLELDIIAAVVIGGASLSGGTGSIAGSMIGALMMAVLRNGSSQMGWPNYIQEIIIGIVIVLAVGLDKWRQSRAAMRGSG